MNKYKKYRLTKDKQPYSKEIIEKNVMYFVLHFLRLI